MESTRSGFSQIRCALILIGACSFFLVSGHTAGKVAPGQVKWRLSDPVTYRNLTVYPLLARGGADTSGFATLDEALTAGEVIVTETGVDILRRTRGANPSGRVLPMQSGAQVNQLVLVNRGKKPLLLLAGEVVSGGKQDRIIAKDRIVSPGAEPLPLDVFCVERGRWAGGSAQFSAAKMMVHPSVREKAVVDQSQTEIWAAVRGASARIEPGMSRRNTGGISAVIGVVVSAEAPSESYAKIYQSSRINGQVEDFAEEFARRFARATTSLKDERVVGIVVAYGGEVAWADAFASPGLFNAYWTKLIRSYSVEALTRGEKDGQPSLEDVRQFIQPLTGHETVESEPGVYRWHQIAQGRQSEIYLDSLGADNLTLHYCKVLRTGN
jgi:hypothetical protein